MIDALRADTRFALRLACNGPGSFALLLSIASAGIASMTAMFSVDGWALAAAVLSCLLSGALSGLLPALTASRLDRRAARDITLRNALGAPPATLAWLVVREGLGWLGLGILLGAPISMIGFGALVRIIPLTPFFEPWVYAVVAAALAGAGVLASMVVSLRAIRRTPMHALRYE